jgi:hypothetical protein
VGASCPVGEMAVLPGPALYWHCGGVGEIWSVGGPFAEIGKLGSKLSFTRWEKESGPDETRTRDLRHARAARRFAGVFRRVQNACKWQHSDDGAFLSISGDLLGLLHGCCTEMLRLLHQHKVWDDQHLTCCLEANYASFVQGIFSEFR